MKSNTVTLAEREQKLNAVDQRIDDCEHYWVIETANGPVSSGVCQLCGSRREFHNYLSNCLANNDREKFEEWLAKHGRDKPKRRGSLGVL